jgi:hypothetical protein
MFTSAAFDLLTGIICINPNLLIAVGTAKYNKIWFFSTCLSNRLRNANRILAFGTGGKFSSVFIGGFYFMITFATIEFDHLYSLLDMLLFAYPDDHHSNLSESLLPTKKEINMRDLITVDRFEECQIQAW